jgi:hypothetical protein
VHDATFLNVQENRRVRARLVTGFAAIGIAAGVVMACVELKGQLGSDCLKNQDCQSGVCSQLKCAEPPPLFEFEAGPDAGPDAADGGTPGTDGPVSTTDGTAETDAPADGTVIGPDGGPEAVDAATDAVDETPGADAAADAPIDASADARLDAGDPG